MPPTPSCLPSRPQQVGNFCLAESGAILLYLCSRYHLADHWCAWLRWVGGRASVQAYAAMPVLALL